MRQSDAANEKVFRFSLRRMQLQSTSSRHTSLHRDEMFILATIQWIHNCFTSRQLRIKEFERLYWKASAFSWESCPASVSRVKRRTLTFLSDADVAP